VKPTRDLVFLRRLACRPSFEHRSLSRLAWERGWHFDDRWPAGPKQSAYVRWMTGSSVVYLISNWPTGALLTCADGDEAAELLELLRMLDVYTLDELVELLDAEQRPEPRMQLLFRVAFAATPWGCLAGAAPDPRVVERLVAAGADRERNVRYGAIVGTSVLGWPELDPLLVRSRDGDADPELRALSERILTNLQDARR